MADFAERVFSRLLREFSGQRVGGRSHNAAYAPVPSSRKAGLMKKNTQRRQVGAEDKDVRSENAAQSQNPKIRIKGNAAGALCPRALSRREIENESRANQSSANPSKLTRVHALARITGIQQPHLSRTSMSVISSHSWDDEIETTINAPAGCQNVQMCAGGQGGKGGDGDSNGGGGGGGGGGFAWATYPCVEGDVVTISIGDNYAHANVCHDSEYKGVMGNKGGEGSLTDGGEGGPGSNDVSNPFLWGKKGGNGAAPTSEVGGGGGQGASQWDGGDATGQTGAGGGGNGGPNAYGGLAASSSHGGCGAGGGGPNEEGRPGNKPHVSVIFLSH